MAERINLNADLGESFGAWSMGDDASMLEVVKSANVACGFHAGDPLVMRQTVATAKRCDVSLGAHPSFPDLQGFGRRRMDVPAAELEAMLIYQIGALAGIARTDGMEVTHVKPHGALNNMACADAKLAATVARAVRAFDPNLILLAPALSQLVIAGREAGLRVVEEIFADRAYLDDGNLVPRSQPGAMIHGADGCLHHVLDMLEAGALISINGKRLPVKAQSICVHGDDAEAVATARVLREGLLRAGYELVAIPELA
ncbi:LamB/YcsF family protein [Aromatoleum petrolei]|uniref:5-oxoprolinase subunit A n=1 Tax=Aromatoleum petrolei TaxID=76116 RepID=A0ABX1MS71_9RHOO|nr:5-oxoprolinase subunit PxpA [Aromatoleum petrolei]NMF90827.1 5-oxoprolinase subunit PxpA [Aromatoleum petrolei]QTQ35626.1 5-oxoprolinase, subunit A [Aromatoleum petrolei]